MQNIIFWGHGSWNPADGYATVPAGCMLFLFARHREENSSGEMGTRMHSIANRVVESIRDGVGWMNNQRFGSVRDADNNHLRRIKLPGDRVQNYRLTYPHGLGWPVDWDRPGDEDSPGWEWYDDAAPNRIVWTNVEGGETLQDLMHWHAAVGTKFLWLPCRAQAGLPSIIDGHVYHGTDGLHPQGTTYNRPHPQYFRRGKSVLPPGFRRHEV